MVKISSKDDPCKSYEVTEWSKVAGMGSYSVSLVLCSAFYEGGSDRVVDRASDLDYLNLYLDNFKAV